MFRKLTAGTALLAAITLIALANGLTSCKKKEDVDPSKGLSVKIQNIVSETALTDLKAKGFTVNEGSQPPNIEGVFISNPMRLLSPYGPNDSYAKGRIIDDYKYRFYAQTGDDLKLDYKNSGTDTGTGQGAFLSGFGNKFTVFIETTGKSGAVDYKSVKVISGEISTTGIINFQEALTLTSKTNDTGNALIPVNQARVWEDGNRLAAKTSTYRIGIADNSPAVSPDGSASNQ